MSAPQIPNLLTMKRGGPRLRGGGRGNRGGSSAGESMPPPGLPLTPEQVAARHDRIIQQTDTDALHSRISSASAGYLNDRYSMSFTADDPGRRMPLINRGTYVRTICIDSLVEKFLTTVKGHKQIVSLGAGTDTRYWRLREKGLGADLFYHEIDYPKVSERKLDAIRTSKVLSGPTSPFITTHKSSAQLEPLTHAWGFQRPEQHWEGYLFHPMDIRILGATRKPGSFLQGELTHSSSPLTLKRNIPTLLISECCLCYLEVEEAMNVLRYFTDTVVDVGIILYEPTHPEDEFGQMMSKNLASRGIKMPTVQKYTTLESQLERMHDAGFKTFGKIADIDFLWEKWITTAEKDRINQLEGLDEVEEWQLLARHYSIAWAFTEQDHATRHPLITSLPYTSPADHPLTFWRSWKDFASMHTDRNAHGVALLDTEALRRRKAKDLDVKYGAAAQ